MVCTFGDATDVTWWREQKLPLRQIVGRDGRLVPVTFGSDGFPSRDARRRQRALREIARKGVGGARQAIVEMLRDAASDATGIGTGPAARRAEADRALGQVLREGRSAARVHLDAPVVRAPPRQEGRAARHRRPDPLASGLHAAALPQLDREPERRLVREPAALLRRAVPGLVPARRATGSPTTRTRSSRPPRALPVDPTVDVPPGYDDDQRDQPGGFTAEADVYDTWFTSSLTPQIGSGWLLDPRAPRGALSRRHPPAEPRDHPHLGLLHDRQGACCTSRPFPGTTS